MVCVDTIGLHTGTVLREVACDVTQIRSLSSLNLGVTYDVTLRGHAPFRGRLLTKTENAEEAVFIVNGEQRVVRAAEFTSAKPVTGRRWWRR